MTQRCAWTSKQIAALSEAYRGGTTSIELARRLGVSFGHVLTVLRRAGVPIRTNSQAQRRHALDETYFDAVDSEAKAYWLGFIAADGCVTDRNRLQLSLSHTDAGHLAKFRDAIGSTLPVRLVQSDTTFGPSLTARFNVRSDALVAALGRHGVGRRKSLTARPSRVSATLVRHYWRGVFDGDGGLWQERFQARWCLTLVGSRSMVAGFARFARAASGSRATVRQAARIYRYDLANRRAVALLRALYDDATVYLDRKHALYRAALERYPPRR